MQHELNEKRHVWRTEVDVSARDVPSALRVTVHNGRLLVTLRDKQLGAVELPPTAYTSDARATLSPAATPGGRVQLRVEMSAKDPSAPAMLEKAALDPDGPHPRELPLTVEGVRGAASGVPLKQDPTGRGMPTPAQAEYGERRDELFGRRGGAAIIMPDANLASTVATDMPVITLPGAAVEAAADNGETVVQDSTTSDTRIYVPHLDQLADRLGRAELAPPHTTVVRGSRDKVVEREYGSADVGATPDQYARKPVDLTEEKVGMATRPLEARDFYSTSEAGPEPYSTMKAHKMQGAAPAAAGACDICQCSPCQCSMVKGMNIEDVQVAPKHGPTHMSDTSRNTVG